MAENKKPPSPQFNYVTANRFYVEIEGQIKAWFSECSCIAVTLKTQSLIEGVVKDHHRFI